MLTRAGSIKLFGFYWVFFLIVFLQFPLAGSLTGDLDTWANLAMYKVLGNNIQSLFTGQSVGQPNYPCRHEWVNFGLDFFLGVIFLGFKVLRVSDLWGYYLFITSVLALNGVAIFKLAKSYGLKMPYAFLAGIFFCLSNFVLGNIDNPNIVGIFPGVLACYYLKRKTGSYSIAVSMVLMGLQFLIAPVTISYFVIIYSVIAAFNFPTVLGKVLENKAGIILAGIICVTLASPYIYNYLIIKVTEGNFNVIKEVAQIKDVSLNLDDFLHALPNNLLYSYTDKYNYPWLTLLKSAFLGFSSFILIALVLFRAANKYKEIFIVMLMGFLMSLGPYVVYDSTVLYKSPLFFFFDIHFVQSFFRIPARAFIMVSLTAAIIVPVALGWLISGKKMWMKGLGVFMLIFWVVENLPMPFVKYNSVSALNYNQKYCESFEGHKPVNIANLPSALFDYKGDRRDYWYMYWQTLNKQNVINGAMSYMPYERMRNDTLCKNITDNSALARLIRVNNLNYIVFHEKLCYGEEIKQKQVLDSSLMLNAVYADSNVTVYKIN